ncbi:hypothetical protein [Synechococcus sp. ROS8604]|uniref:hypothetical protein n=1 Tax=Synechococcus sp. ROS8604 TaxID=1442557 RepID=UPI0016493062|nr:hypothetical protein [Synechococcus sp. ROS8604]QNI89922.1 hypothetical protein SynROS8604_03314 [Synechococcus sp. ROS8604]
MGRFKEKFWLFLAILFVAACGGFLFSGFHKRFIILEFIHPSRASELDRQMEGVFGFMGGAGKVLWYEADKTIEAGQHYAFKDGSSDESAVIQSSCEDKVAFMNANHNEPAEILEGDLDRLLSKGAMQISSIKNNISVELVRKFWIYTAPRKQDSPFLFNLSGKISSVDDNSPESYTSQSQSKRSAYCSGRVVTLQIPNYVRLISLFDHDSVIR